MPEGKSGRSTLPLYLVTVFLVIVPSFFLTSEWIAHFFLYQDIRLDYNIRVVSALFGGGVILMLLFYFIRWKWLSILLSVLISIYFIILLCGFYTIRKTVYYGYYDSTSIPGNYDDREKIYDNARSIGFDPPYIIFFRDTDEGIRNPTKRADLSARNISGKVNDLFGAGKIGFLAGLAHIGDVRKERLAGILESGEILFVKSSITREEAKKSGKFDFIIGSHSGAIGALRRLGMDGPSTHDV